MSAATPRGEPRTSPIKRPTLRGRSIGVNLLVALCPPSSPAVCPEDLPPIAIWWASSSRWQLWFLCPNGGSTSTRAIATGAVTVYAFTGWLGLVDHTLIRSETGSPSYTLANAVARVARREHLAVGYGSYLDAAPITWATHTQVKVFPVDDCDGNQHLCAYEQHIMTSWYTPRQGVKTFLLTDPGFTVAGSAPTPDLGKPLAVHQFGAVTMYVYPYDIAARLYAL